MKALALLALFAAALVPAGSSAQDRDPAALPDTEFARGEAGIAAAWFIAPTGRYDHHVRPTQYEAGGLRVRTAAGETITLMLDERQVFEDRTPRLADLDGDGRDEIVTILSSITKGASLAAYTVSDGAIELLARTPFIGTSHRWLNPAGIADYDGDGSLDIAFVAMPHLVKRLEVWTLSDGGFSQLLTVPDVSNHALGSPHTGLSASADFNADGITDLAVPSGDRRAVRLLSFAGGSPAEIGRRALSARIAGDFGLERSDGGPILTVPLAGGEIARLTP